MIAACLAVGVLLAVIVLLLRHHDRERQAWGKERNLLISRIQTPQVAPSLAFPETDDEPEPSLIMGADGDFYRDGKVVE